MLISVWVLCASLGTRRVQKRASDSMEVELEAVANHLTWCWELNLDSLRGQHIHALNF